MDKEALKAQVLELLNNKYYEKKLKRLSIGYNKMDRCSFRILR
jgi:hypothetical protein